MMMLQREQVLAALQACRGRDNGVSASMLCQALLFPNATPAAERRLRQLVEELRLEGHPICSHPSSGYFMAGSPDEIEAACAFLHSRAMTSLKQIARLRQIALPELLGQLRLQEVANQ